MNPESGLGAENWKRDGWMLRPERTSRERTRFETWLTLDDEGFVGPIRNDRIFRCSVWTTFDIEMGSGGSAEAPAFGRNR